MKNTKNWKIDLVLSTVENGIFTTREKVDIFTSQIAKTGVKALYSGVIHEEWQTVNSTLYYDPESRTYIQMDIHDADYGIAIFYSIF